MKSSQNTVWVAGAGVLAALLVVLTYLFVIAPQRTEAADLATQQVSVQENNVAIQQKTVQLASAFETLPEKRAELASIESTLPAEAEVPDLLRALETYATSAGVAVTQIAPGEPSAFASGTTSASGNATPTGIVQIPLTLAVSGSFPQIELYLKNLQVDLPRHVLVQGVTVNTEASGGNSAGVTATITGSIFVIQDEATASAARTSDTAPSATGSATTTTTTSTTTTTGTVS